MRARARATATLATMLLGLAGCGQSPVQVTVGGRMLTALDQGYFTTTGTQYCNAAAPGELMLDFVDYNYICDPHNPPQRDPALSHMELQLVLAQDPNLNPARAYVVGTADCTNGPTAEAIARFLHYPPNSKMPDVTTQADSGTVTLSSFPKDRTKAIVGSFDLVYGATHVKSSFSVYACN